jgi:hypothetical protein
MDLRPQTPWEASLAIWTKCLVVPWLGCIPQELGHSLTAREVKIQLWSLPFLAPETRNVVGTDEGNKVAETIFTGSREFIMLVDLGNNFSKPRAPICVRSWVKYLQSLSPNPLQNVVTVTGNTAELPGGL